MSFLSMLRLWSILLLIAVLSGCYHFTNSQPGKLVTGQQIWIPFFGNESISPTAQTVLRRTFYDEIYALRGIKPASSERSADFFMKAKLISYGSKAVSYSAIDQVKEISLSIDVELEITKKGDSVPFWKGRIQSAKQFPTNSNLALQRNAEEQALDAVARVVAHKFISALEESY